MYYFNFFWLIQNVYILKHGISFTKLSVILVLWTISMMVLNIPSGVVADRFSRKWTIVAGKLAFLVGISIFALFPSFIGFTIGVLLFGVHEAFIAGAQEAILYDTLKDHRKEHLFGKVTAIATTSREVGLGLGLLIAGFVTQISIGYNLVGSVCLAAIGVAISIMLTETRSHTASDQGKYLHHLRQSVTAIQKSYQLKRIVLFSATVLAAYLVITEYFVVALKAVHLSYVSVGFLAAIEACFFTVGSFLSQRIHAEDRGHVYLVLAILMSAFLLVIAQGAALLVIVGFLALRTVKAVGEIITTTDWQEYVESKHRATSMSANSFIQSMVYVLFGLVFGKIADTSGLFHGFYLAAVLPVIYLAVVILFFRQHRQSPSLPL